MVYKKLVTFILIGAFIVLPCPSLSFALPSGENVVSGSATFDYSTPNTLNINTPSEKLIVDYNSFNIANQEGVFFYQPSSNSVALNRVVGIDPSLIFGTLTANGRIFIINPNGVIFGPNSRVDVAALVASTLSISNEDFLAGEYTFSRFDGIVGASILNQGYIKADSVALLGSAVANEGLIEAMLGSVNLASGDALTLNLDAAGTISVVVDEAVQGEVFGVDGENLLSAVDNSGEIIAPARVTLPPSLAVVVPAE